MNGRVYDPELGRFMSADPFVQAPYNTQSYNRYSYVFNNPLSFTDPNGYQARTVEDIHVPGRDTQEDLRRQREQERENGNRYAAEQMAREYIEQMIAYSMSERTFSTPNGVVRITISDPVKAAAGVSGVQNASDGEVRGTSGGRGAFDKSLDSLNAIVRSLANFDSKDDALNWLHDNVHPLAVDYDYEITANIFKDGANWRVGTLGTNYDAHFVDIYTSKAPGRSWQWKANWHSHADGVSSGFSGIDKNLYSRVNANRAFPISFHVSVMNDGGGHDLKHY